MDVKKCKKRKLSQGQVNSLKDSSACKESSNKDLESVMLGSQDAEIAKVHQLDNNLFFFGDLVI